ncbi:MAG: PHP domain-containing protein, partial [Candidatus Gastranaerophilales bacterium]|nr:PHP domain-containing protein [Candidatus Gastranaerophilales bacterium]
MFADYHIHTTYSEDSTINMEECVKHAINLKLNEICFTDHIDYGAPF